MKVYSLYLHSPNIEPHEGFWVSREQAEMAGEMYGIDYVINEHEVLG
jgi:hypothetical protein